MNPEIKYFAICSSTKLIYSYNTIPEIDPIIQNLISNLNFGRNIKISLGSNPITFNYSLDYEVCDHFVYILLTSGSFPLSICFDLISKIRDEFTNELIELANFTEVNEVNELEEIRELNELNELEELNNVDEIDDAIIKSLNIKQIILKYIHFYTNLAIKEIEIRNQYSNEINEYIQNTKEILRKILSTRKEDYSTRYEDYIKLDGFID